MTKNIFLDELSSCLLGEVTSDEYQESMKYYSDYIESRVRDGENEEYVVGSIGNPRLIAKTIIETNNTKHNSSSKDKEEKSKNKQQKQKYNKHKGFSMSRDTDGKWDIRIGKLKLNTWYGKIIVALALVLLLAIIFALLSGIVYILLVFVLPVLIVAAVVYLIYKSFTK